MPRPRTRPQCQALRERRNAWHRICKADPVSRARGAAAARRRYCSDVCRSKAYRRRRAGRPENRRREGAQRGPVRLEAETAAVRQQVRLSDWFVDFRREIERVHRESAILRAETCALRAETERQRRGA